LIAVVRFLIIFCIGVSATLAWQSYGDRARGMIASQSYGSAAREMIGSLYSQLSWLAPQAKPVAQNTPDVIGLASPSTSSQQQPKLLDVEALRQSIDRIATSIASGQEQMTSSADRIATSQDQIARSVDRIATSQEQIARSVDRLTADQEQMTREITKLQEIERSIRLKNSEASPRPASAPAPKPIPASPKQLP
jgi:septal ring factor EnvC (AmiA/AmiB activator)